MMEKLFPRPLQIFLVRALENWKSLRKNLFAYLRPPVAIHNLAPVVQALEISFY